MSTEDYAYKTLILGDANVGKSNMLLRYITGKFESEPVMKPPDFLEASIQTEQKVAKLQIWDTAGEVLLTLGQERFRTITSSFYRGALGVILVFDVTDRGTVI